MTLSCKSGWKFLHPGLTTGSRPKSRLQPENVRRGRQTPMWVSEDHYCSTPCTREWGQGRRKKPIKIQIPSFLSSGVPLTPSKSTPFVPHPSHVVLCRRSRPCRSSDLSRGLGTGSGGSLPRLSPDPSSNSTNCVGCKTGGSRAVSTVCDRRFGSRIGGVPGCGTRTTVLTRPSAYS